MKLKQNGLEWTPHAGCFVWDPDEYITVPSPFPGRIYFILNLNHFIRILGSREEIAQKLVWLPTWHQARRILKDYLSHELLFAEIMTQLKTDDSLNELTVLYQLIMQKIISGDISVKKNH